MDGFYHYGIQQIQLAQRCLTLYQIRRLPPKACRCGTDHEGPCQVIAGLTHCCSLWVIHDCETVAATPDLADQEGDLYIHESCFRKSSSCGQRHSPYLALMPPATRSRLTGRHASGEELPEQQNPRM